MVRLSKEFVQDYMIKYNKTRHPAPDPDEYQGPESKLQSKAEKWCREHGYPYFHDRSRKKNEPGKILDLYIFMPKARTVIIEFKTKGNKLTKEQKETYLQLLYLGHEVHEVRSFKRFLEIVNNNNHLTQGE